MTHRGFSIIGALVVWIASAAPVAAQPTDQPEADERPRAESFLGVNVDLFGAVDRAFGSVDETQTQIGDRSYWGGNSQFAYEKAAGRYTFAADAGASVRRLTDVTDGLMPSYTGSVRAAGPLSRRTRWEIEQLLEYGPINAVAFFAPGDPIEGAQTTLPLVDYRLNDQNQLTSVTRGSLGYSVSRRGTLSLTAGYDRATSAYTPEQTANTGAFRRWHLGGQYSNRVTRYMSWYAGYSGTRNSIGIDSSSLDSTPLLHSIDSGIAYGRPLSFSRRTHVSGQIGSTVLRDRVTRDPQWRLDGVASLRHEIGRTWQAYLAFQRNTQYLQAFADPVASDAVTVRLGGSLTEKASLDLLANYARGRVGFSDTGNNGYTLASTSASFRYAFLRQLAAYIEYFLFDSDFDSAVTLGDVRVSDSQRHGVRVGISIGTGLWGNRRRALGNPFGESTR